MDGGSLTGTNGDPLDHQSVVGNIVSQSVSQSVRQAVATHSRHSRHSESVGRRSSQHHSIDEIQSLLNEILYL